MKGDSNSMFSLDGKVAVITGASRGIGEEIAKVFSRAGARLVICSRKQEALEKVADTIRHDGGEVLAVPANVSAEEDRATIIDAAMEWGSRIDILVNNAGANPKHGPLAKLAESELDKVLDVNLKAPLFLSQLTYRSWMKANGGVVLNISSIGGFECFAGINGYNVVKAALNHLTKCLASEWGHEGVRVNALAPGLIKTQFSRALWEKPTFMKMIEHQPVPRIGEVEDLAGAALFLASEASSYITGHILIIDGGALVSG